MLFRLRESFRPRYSDWHSCFNEQLLQVCRCVAGTWPHYTALFFEFWTDRQDPRQLICACCILHLESKRERFGRLVEVSAVKLVGKLVVLARRNVETCVPSFRTSGLLLPSSIHNFPTLASAWPLFQTEIFLRRVLLPRNLLGFLARLNGLEISALHM